MVAQIVGRPWSTVKSFLDQTQKGGEKPENLLYSGRSEKLNYQEKHQLVHAACRNHTITRRKLRNRNCPNVSISTIDQVLRAIKMKK